MTSNEPDWSFPFEESLHAVFPALHDAQSSWLSQIDSLRAPDRKTHELIRLACTVILRNGPGVERHAKFATEFGATWEEIPSAPLLHLVDWATGDDVVGVTPDGTALTSADAGITWQQASALPSNAVALTAAAPHDGGIEIVAVVEGALWRSTDNGGHFVRAEIPSPSA